MQSHILFFYCTQFALIFLDPISILHVSYIGSCDW